MPQGTAVRFTLRPHRQTQVLGGSLCARFELDGDRSVSLPLQWEGLDGTCDRFCVTLPTGDYVGLVWYSFHLRCRFGEEQTLGEYRFTVYDEALPVPDWFGKGVTYQIFPDRFARSKPPAAEGLVGERQLHENWSDEPVYLPNEQGKITNSDFFGGDFAGMLEKLPYLQSLGVRTIYLNPIFEAAENHRYGTADYETIDPMLGTNEDFSRFCDAARALGMRVMLDGVFNHTGCISRYFGGDSSYAELGAKQGEASPYHSWFHFTRWPEEYESWWGISTLPQVNESDPSYLAYMLDGPDSIVRRWLRAGADGWRLDVADELPDEFIARLRTAVYEEKPDAAVIGEVWEDGSSKIAYGVRRRHLLGGHLDGLMNYPFRTALLGFLDGDDASVFMTEMEVLRRHYPAWAYHNAMNSLGTHDTPRIITLLGAGALAQGSDRHWRAAFRMDEAQYEHGKRLLKLGALVMYCFPGSPTLYYGDEVGLQGFEDPFNRRTFPWGSEDAELLAYFRLLGKARCDLAPLQQGAIRYICAEGGLLAFVREQEGERILCAVNRSDEAAYFSLPWAGAIATDFLSGVGYAVDEDGLLCLTLAPQQGVLLVSL